MAGTYESFAIWNNKGGVGKSTITFHLATRYAELNPESDVLVIDLCPQANVSMLLLGGGIAGETNIKSLMAQHSPPTVVGYIGDVLSKGQGAVRPNPTTYYTRVASFNNRVSTNVYLLCGDPNLEPMAPLIVYYANTPNVIAGQQSWKWVHELILMFIEDTSAARGKDLVVFIDTNPSFAIYTELAISAAKRIIAPVNADDSSRLATETMFILLHGSNPPHPIYGRYTFATMAAQSGLAVPQLHLMIGNRLTQYVGAATAFQALSNSTATSLHNEFLNHPQRFTQRAVPVASIGDFRSQYSVPLRDFNTAGVVAAHQGCPLSSLQPGNHTILGSPVQVQRARINDCISAIDDIIAFL